MRRAAAKSTSAIQQLAAPSLFSNSSSRACLGSSVLRCSSESIEPKSAVTTASVQRRPPAAAGASSGGLIDENERLAEHSPSRAPSPGVLPSFALSDDLSSPVSVMSSTT